jgi:hypothetical protein
MLVSLKIFSLSTCVSNLGSICIEGTQIDRETELDCRKSRLIMSNLDDVTKCLVVEIAVVMTLYRKVIL